MRKLLRSTLPIVFMLWSVAAAAEPAVGAVHPAPAWARTLAHASSAVVSIHVDAPRAFDTESNASEEATGFVVDAKRGLILTNRHVVQPGPAVAEAVFNNHESVPLQPIYRDPVHDFGFYHYDPDALKYIHPKALKLNPQGARIGREIRVIGNDAGEQQSILAGTLARLDRGAPAYGRSGYNDFNTFYMQAVSGTTGGSSGSPVIDIEGDVIGLNAGGRSDASSSYFLPLDEVVRALKLIQRNKPVPRGTLETIFEHTDYDELERLGLRPKTETTFRRLNSSNTGMLVVSEVVPGGPAAGRLAPGDIVVGIDGKHLSSFVSLEWVLDSNVGHTIDISVERGGRRVTIKVPVTDLYRITPSSYIEFGGAVLNNLSFEQARNLNKPVHGVYLADAGYVFDTGAIPQGAVITAIDGKPVSDLNDFQTLFKTWPDRQRVRIRYFASNDPNHMQLGIIDVDRRWFPAERCRRNSKTGFWPCKDLPAPPKPQAHQSIAVNYPRYREPRAEALASSLVFVNFDMPYRIDGIGDTHYAGTGVVVDAKRGLVVVDRDTVPVAMGDVRLTFAGSVEIPGKVVYVHPLHDLAVISYNPRLLGSTPVKSVRFSPHAMDAGKPVWVVGYQPDQTLLAQASRISSIDPVRFPLSPTLRYRDSNLDIAQLTYAPKNVDGVLADAKGRMVALWAGFAYGGAPHTQETTGGISVDIVRKMVNIVESNGGEKLRTLDVEFNLMPLASARKLGLPDKTANKLENSLHGRRQLLAVVRIAAGSPADHRLQSGDLLLTIDGQPVNTFRDVEKAVQRDHVTLKILRNGQVKTLSLPTVALNGQGTQRLLVWAGALLQRPHRAVAVQRHMLRNGVFVGYYYYGSPANHYGLSSGVRIVAVNGHPTPNIASFIKAIQGEKNRDPVRLKTITWDGQVEVKTLKLDLRYYPTYEVLHTKDGWARRPISQSPDAKD